MSATPARVVPFRIRRRPDAQTRQAERDRQGKFKAAIDRADRILATYEARAVKFDQLIKSLTVRKKHALARRDAIQEGVLAWMTDAGIDKLTGNRATLSKRANAPSLVVDDESLIPERFFRTVEKREVNKVLIKAVLAEQAAAEERDQPIREEDRIGGVHLAQSISLIRSE